jgi:hypothetical protein
VGSEAVNQARSGRHYRPEEFEPERRYIARLGWWGIVMVLAGYVLSCFLAAHFGAWYQRQINERAIARIPICSACPAPATSPTRWSCVPHEVAEHREACLHRDRNALTKPKE